MRLARLAPAAALALAWACGASRQGQPPAGAAVRPVARERPSAAPSGALEPGRELPRVAIATALGELKVEVDSVHAPITATNFLRYVDAGAYAGGAFHRTVTLDNQPDDAVKIEVVQAGPDRERFQDFPPIPLERTSVTRLSHMDGTISMARDGPDTATSDFFITIGAQPDLDFGGRRNPDGQGFAAFGHVLSGMDVVRRIQRSPARGQTLTPSIQILDLRRVAGAGADEVSPDR